MEGEGVGTVRSFLKGGHTEQISGEQEMPGSLTRGERDERFLSSLKIEKRFIILFIYKG